jgi:hypothetical protein
MEVIAETTGMPFCGLSKEPPDPKLLFRPDPEQLARDGWIPVRELPDGSVLVAGDHAPPPALLSSIQQALGRPVTYHAVDPVPGVAGDSRAHLGRAVSRLVAVAPPSYAIMGPCALWIS